MNKDDIIRMAREAGGFLGELPMGDAWLFFEEQQLERFADLVVAAERERIIAANAPEIEKTNSHIKALEDELAAERKAFESEYPVKFASVQAFEDWCSSIRSNEQKACMALENEIAKSPAFFATMAEWHAYREGVQEIILAIRERGEKL